MIFVKKMARFYGNAPDCVSDGAEQFIVNSSSQVDEHEVVVSNEQGSQAMLLLCQQMNSEVKNLRMEVASLKQSMDHIKTKNGQDVSKKQASKKLHKDLSVSNAVII